MKLIPLSQAKNTLSQVVLDAAESPVVITKNGVAAAVVIVPQDDDDLERLVLYRSKKLQKLLESRVAVSAQGERLGFDEFWAEVEKSSKNV
jgi:prevent-host-death family protein